MQLNDYFDRISLEGTPEVNMKWLKLLQRHHLYSVPFENLDIYYGRKILLDRQKAWNKLIHAKRGGFCYEQNEVFFIVLSEIGFHIKRVSAAVYNPDKKTFGRDHGHMTLVVHLEENDYLVDVGFGRFSMHPLLMKDTLVQHDALGEFKLNWDAEGYWTVSQVQQGEWVPGFRFHPDARTYETFEGMCHHHQTSPESRFSTGAVCSIPVVNGRLTLTDKEFITDLHGEETKIAMTSKKDFEDTLWEVFQIRL